MSLRQYVKKATRPVRAVQLNLPGCKLSYEKWGDSQTAGSGDWLVINGDNSYTVQRDSFRDTYRHLYGDWYRKTAPVWAEIAAADGHIATREGVSHYRAGDYLVYNQPDRNDGYTVPHQEFELNYRPLGEQSMPMSMDDYVQTRLDDQIDWYDKKASINQNRYKRLQLMAIIFGASIPLLTAISFKEFETLFRFIIALLGSAIAVVSGVLSLNKYQENWVKYRSCAEVLRREKYHYLTSTGNYTVDNADRDALFVGRCENIMANEQTDWMKAILPQRLAGRDNVGKDNK